MDAQPATATVTAAAAPQPPASVDDWEHNQLKKLRRYLLLLASLAATVTYAAGIDPPGGSYVESEDEHKAGDSILRATHHHRYLAFYYSNATAFAASLVVILLLLVLPDKKKKDDRRTGRFGFLWQQTTHLGVLRLVMVLDLLALMVAYTAGSCRDKVSTIYTAVLVLALSAYVGYHILQALRDKFNRAHAARRPRAVDDPLIELEQLRKVLMLLSIFAATITYDAGLNPPGGFWEHTNGGLHRTGEVILKHKHGGRFAVFFFCNTATFIASLFTVVLLLDKRLTASAIWRLKVLYGFVLVTLVTLVAAYAAGSCRKTTTTAYTAALAAPVLVSIFLAAAAHYIRLWCMRASEPQPQQEDGQPDDPLRETKSLILLLGTLAASITYQAGMNPPGGVWLETKSGHKAGDPILSYTDAKRYNIFFYCNSTALVASIVVILIVQIKSLLKRRALHVHLAMILDMLGLVGAYIAGSSRTLRASVHLIVLAAVFLVYVTVTYLHVIKFKQEPGDGDGTRTSNEAANTDEKSLKKRRKRLLLFAILMAAISYQAGLSPPGGFWRQEQGGQEGHPTFGVGSPILEDMYPRRYKAFFYCNAMSFMASIALIILLQDDRTYKKVGIRLYCLYACMLVGMLVLMGAYAAGSARRLKTSIYVFVLVGGVIVFIALLLALFLHIRGRPSGPAGGGTAGNDDHNLKDDNRHHQGDADHATKRKYVMLLAMLAASVTYEAGLDPPGGVWSEGYAAGSPVLHDSNLRRYRVFFYSNSSSFVASIVIIILLLLSEQRNMPPGREQRRGSDDDPHDDPLLMATNTVIALDMVGLLVAYAAGSSRTLETSLYVIALVVAVVIYIVAVRLPDAINSGPGEGTSNTQGAGQR